MLKGSPKIPGDKSISHRALILSALAEGKSEISYLLDSADVNSTWSCLEALGVSIKKHGKKIWVQGLGLDSLKQASGKLDCGNSGTTLRLLMGVLAGQKFDSVLVGDTSLSKRPMNRVAEPLRTMGAEISLSNQNYAPVNIKGSSLKATHYELPIASAQVKSAIMLAALFCPETTRISGLIHSRDHSERMFDLFGADIKISSSEILVTGNKALISRDLRVPGDPSTAAFWMAAAAIVPGSEITLRDISLNPTRLGFLRVLEKMGAHIETEVSVLGPEPMGHVFIKYSNLKAISVAPSEVPSLIDEIPILAIVCTQAHGTSEIRGAEELKVKESDRLNAIAQNLSAMGVKLELLPDGFRITGPQKLKGAVIQSHDDHRIAMAFSIAGLLAKEPTEIVNPECVSISYPHFFDALRDLNQ
ncbi:MAG: 3-phosphoshikimate 1-carboxyvinyltransferase [Myxococcaceae bacterium]